MSSCSRARKVLMNHALHASACQPRNSTHISHLSDNHLNQIWVSQGVTSSDCLVMRRIDTRPPSATAGDVHSCLNTELRWTWKAWWQFVCNYLHSIVIERSGVRISNQLLLPVPGETFCGFHYLRSHIVVSCQNMLVNLEQSSRPPFTVNNYIYQKCT